MSLPPVVSNLGPAKGSSRRRYSAPSKKLVNFEKRIVATPSSGHVALPPIRILSIDGKAYDTNACSSPASVPTATAVSGVAPTLQAPVLQRVPFGSRPNRALRRASLQSIPAPFPVSTSSYLGALTGSNVQYQQENKEDFPEEKTSSPVSVSNIQGVLDSSVKAIAKTSIPSNTPNTDQPASNKEDLNHSGNDRVQKLGYTLSKTQRSVAESIWPNVEFLDGRDSVHTHAISAIARGRAESKNYKNAFRAGAKRVIVISGSNRDLLMAENNRGIEFHMVQPKAAQSRIPSDDNRLFNRPPPNLKHCVSLAPCICTIPNDKITHIVGTHVLYYLSPVDIAKMLVKYNAVAAHFSTHVFPESSGYTGSGEGFYRIINQNEVEMNVTGNSVTYRHSNLAWLLNSDYTTVNFEFEGVNHCEGLTWSHCGTEGDVRNYRFVLSTPLLKTESPVEKRSNYGALQNASRFVGFDNPSDFEFEDVERNSFLKTLDDWNVVSWGTSFLFSSRSLRTYSAPSNLINAGVMACKAMPMNTLTLHHVVRHLTQRVMEGMNLKNDARYPLAVDGRLHLVELDELINNIELIAVICMVKSANNQIRAAELIKASNDLFARANERFVVTPAREGILSKLFTTSTSPQEKLLMVSSPDSIGTNSIPAYGNVPIYKTIQYEPVHVPRDTVTIKEFSNPPEPPEEKTPAYVGVGVQIGAPIVVYGNSHETEIGAITSRMGSIVPEVDEVVFNEYARQFQSNGMFERYIRDVAETLRDKAEEDLFFEWVTQPGKFSVDKQANYVNIKNDLDKQFLIARDVAKICDGSGFIKLEIASKPKEDSVEAGTAKPRAIISCSDEYNVLVAPRTTAVAKVMREKMRCNITSGDGKNAAQLGRWVVEHVKYDPVTFKLKDIVIEGDYSRFEATQHRGFADIWTRLMEAGGSTPETLACLRYKSEIVTAVFRSVKFISNAIKPSGVPDTLVSNTMHGSCVMLFALVKHFKLTPDQAMSCIHILETGDDNLTVMGHDSLVKMGIVVTNADLKEISSLINKLGMENVITLREHLYEVEFCSGIFMPVDPMCNPERTPLMLVNKPFKCMTKFSFVPQKFLAPDNGGQFLREKIKGIEGVASVTPGLYSYARHLSRMLPRSNGTVTIPYEFKSYIQAECTQQEPTQQAKHFCIQRYGADIEGVMESLLAGVTSIPITLPSQTLAQFFIKDA